MGKSRNSLMGDPKTSLRTQVSRESSTSVRSVKEAPIRRSADKDMRLPAVAAPSIGIRVTIDEDEPGETADLVERLMGKKPEMRYQYIQENAKFVEELDV